MATGIVQSVEFNVSKTSKAGKDYQVTILKYVTDKGQAKTENAFKGVDYEAELMKLAPGDKIEVKYEKKQFNGKDVWNMIGVVLLEKGDGVAPTAGGFGAKKSSTETPEKQASIERQNGLTNAVNLMGKMLDREMFKKTCTPDFLVNECIRIANHFQDYTSGRLALTQLVSQTTAGVIGTTLETPVVDPTDVPFDMNDIPQ